MKRFALFCVYVAFVFIPATSVPADDAALQREAADALKRAVTFFHEEVATEGGYLWRYSDDLQTREGEGRADDQTVWVQPPGTPTIGAALLDAYRATGDEYYLGAATDAAMCLVRGQLASGGWDYRIVFSPQERERYAYRADGRSTGRNTTTLDDNTTQDALRFLMRMDQELQFKNEAIHEAVEYGLDAILKSQYPNGAWPQRFTGPIDDPSQYPVKRASYPEAWSREFPGKDYKAFYTFNDNAMADVIDIMFQAARTYGDERYYKAACRAGDFMLLARMPDPQPGWAQQYDLDMHPAWARKFEPPAITGGESQGVMRTLMRIYMETGDRKYLEPIPRALDYYEARLLPDGRIPRFLELKTNRPLYFTIDYRLTYSDADVPTHYAFKVGQSLTTIRKEYERLAAISDDEREEASLALHQKSQPRMSDSLRRQAKAVINAMDDRGAWVEDGRLKYWGDDDPTRRIIDCRTFANNVLVLSRYLAAAGEQAD